MCTGGRKHSNLQSFLAHITPSVPAYPLPKTCIRDLNNLWQPMSKEKAEYFTLGDLWEQYSEWSAYGAAVPIILDNHETVLQYYVPYLSAIQIYTNKSLPCLRMLLEESESESFSDDSESDKMSKSWDALSEDSMISQDSSLPGKEILGQIYLQYVEYGSPYKRMPLMDKVNELVQHFPGLMSFKSVEMSPASWMSVAWYPIYPIPMRNVQDLSACFLTYHTISASFQDNVVPGDSAKDYCPMVAITNKWEQKKGSNSVTLSPFGLSTYRMQGRIWRNPDTSDTEMMDNLYNAAQSWLMQLRVEHHDFEFFATH
ncbi:hypothetical protein C4D60_Mb01t04760 [Musa balbisiana]|uniref:Uncharacterized protein n=1 Tax=Musa balbisiana TaxID=52838 RepID=A0A4S8JK43_MUSBA|nr:hypothetical protein C4D60_Mb01t04760 [Musa balbisiana]